MDSSFRTAVGDDLRFLCALHDREPTPEVLDELRAAEFPECLSLSLTSSSAAAAHRRWRVVRSELPGEIDQQCLDELAADYAAIYLNHSVRASPCESVWLDPDHLALQGPMFAIRRWHRRFGVRASNWRQRSEDHLAMQLGFVAVLFECDKASVADCAAYLDQHLLRWIDDFADRVASCCGTEFYAALALLTAAYLQELREALARTGGIARPQG